MSSDDNGEPADHREVLNVNVGVLGHVDSGKTSLVKALSTLLSTAALDKSKQSRQRGMTLDLGFSCFFVKIPDHLISAFPEKRRLQITLVDCPGHASLIRTIIGGAQIIDMVLLVVDAFKGWQAQTTECLVLAELTSPHLVVALNKADLFPPEEREIALRKAELAVRERLGSTRFASAAVVGVSACVGGEKVAAEDETPSHDNHHRSTAAAVTATGPGTVSAMETFNVDALVQILKDRLPPPRRTSSGPFYFSIDHCFPIRGRGTVLTGTCLSGSASVNDALEFPALGLDRKIKSMQMFKRSVPTVQQGDRAGICVSNLDAKLLERGIASSPGAVHLLKGAIAVVRKVPYFQGTLPCGSKFHVSVGHATVMATVTFWGGRELLTAAQAAEGAAAATATATREDEKVKDGKAGTSRTTSETSSSSSNSKKEMVGSVSLGGDADMAGLPKIPFDFTKDFLQQDQLLESLDDDENQENGASASAGGKKKEKGARPNRPLLHWALLHFQTPVYCPLHSLVIGSRLDAVDGGGGGSNSSNSKDTSSLLSGSASSCRLAFSGRLVTKVDPVQDAARIRLYAPKERRGVVSRLGDAHRRGDDGKIVRYEAFGSDLFKKETNMKAFLGMRVVTGRTRDVGEIKSSFGTAGKFRVHFPAGTTAHEGEELVLRFKRFANDPDKAMHQDLVLPAARSGTRMDAESGKKKGKKQKSKQATAAWPPGIEKVGQVVSLKGDTSEETGGKHGMAIVSGFFAPEINIKEKAGGWRVVIPSTGEEGTVVGPFGKAGKCKVAFAKGVSAPPGTKAELQLG